MADNSKMKKTKVVESVCMKRNLISLFALGALLLLNSCSTEKYYELMDSIKTGVDSCKYDLFAKAYPYSDSMNINFDGCELEFDSAMIKEEKDEVIIPATIIHKNDSNIVDSVAVSFVARENKEGQLYVYDSKGLCFFSKKYPLSSVAVKWGALEPQSSDKDAIAFVQDSSNVSNLQAVMADIKKDMFEFGKFKRIKVRSNFDDPYVGEMYMWYECTEQAEITNKTNFTFSKAVVVVKKLYLDENSLSGYGQSTYWDRIEIKNVRPGKNYVSFNDRGNGNFILDKSSIVDITGIPEEELIQAIKTYKWTGNEYKTTMKK